MNNILCALGLHRWGRATYMDHSIHSNAVEWKQKCERCGYLITWVQPKGLNYRFYPQYWVKRRTLLYLIQMLVVGAIIAIVIVTRR